jgi:hypothetical protein
VRPRIGKEIDRGTEGVIYENLDEPDWVVKEFLAGVTSPFQARNEYQNLAMARAIRPDNVVQARVPIDPRQGWIVKEKVLPTDVPKDRAQEAALLLAFNSIPDAGGNLMWGTTASNPTVRWILVE